MIEPKEVFMLIGRGGAIVWSDVGQSAAHIADSRVRWDAIWERREDVEEVAHSHPVGPARFSEEDKTTMEALDSGLGRAVRYSIVSPEGMVARRGHDGEDERVDDEPWWAALLRRASGMKPWAPVKSREASLEALRRTLAKQLGKRARIKVGGSFDDAGEVDLIVHSPRGDQTWLVVCLGALSEGRKMSSAVAQAGATEMWIVDTRRHSIEVHRRPAGGHFTKKRLHERGAVLSLVAFDEVSVSLDHVV